MSGVKRRQPGESVEPVVKDGTVVRTPLGDVLYVCDGSDPIMQIGLHTPADLSKADGDRFLVAAEPVVIAGSVFRLGLNLFEAQMYYDPSEWQGLGKSAEAVRRQALDMAELRCAEAEGRTADVRRILYGGDGRSPAEILAGLANRGRPASNPARTRGKASS